MNRSKHKKITEMSKTNKKMIFVISLDICFFIVLFFFPHAPTYRVVCVLRMSMESIFYGNCLYSTHQQHQQLNHLKSQNHWKAHNFCCMVLRDIKYICKWIERWNKMFTLNALTTAIHWNQSRQKRKKKWFLNNIGMEMWLEIDI